MIVIIVKLFLDMMQETLLRLSDKQFQANPHIGNKEALVLRSIQTDGY